MGTIFFTGDKNMKIIIPLLLVVILAVSCSTGEYTLCTVSFDSDGGTTVAAEEVIKGRTAVEPKSPEKTGYVFSSWTLDGAKYDFTSAVTEDITLKAEYTVKTAEYTVSFDTDGGTEIASQTVASGSTVIEPKSLEKTGYMFTSWTLDGKTYDFTAPVEKDITLRAAYVSQTSLEAYVILVERIYSMANIIVNKTNLATCGTDITGAFKNTEDAGTLVVTATDRTISKDLYINFNNYLKKYDPDDYTITIKSSGLEENSSSVVGDTTTVILRNLKLKINYKDKNSSGDDSTIITIDPSKEVDKEVLFNSVNITWKKTGTSTFEGIVDLTINGEKSGTLSFTSDSSGLVTAAYNGVYLTRGL